MQEEKNKEEYFHFTASSIREGYWHYCYCYYLIILTIIWSLKVEGNGVCRLGSSPTTDRPPPRQQSYTMCEPIRCTWAWWVIIVIYGLLGNYLLISVSWGTPERALGHDQCMPTKVHTN